MHLLQVDLVCGDHLLDQQQSLKEIKEFVGNEAFQVKHTLQDHIKVAISNLSIDTYLSFAGWSVGASLRLSATPAVLSMKILTGQLHYSKVRHKKLPHKSVNLRASEGVIQVSNRLFFTKSRMLECATIHSMMLPPPCLTDCNMVASHSLQRPYLIFSKYNFCFMLKLLYCCLI